MVVAFDPALTSTKCSLSNSNRTVARASGSGGGSSITTAAPQNSGKWYYEFKITSNNETDWTVGLCDPAFVYESNSVGTDADSANSFAVRNAFIFSFTYKNGVIGDAVTTYALNDIIGVAYDADTRVVTLYQNNSLVYTSAAISAGSYVPAVSPATAAPSSGIGYFDAADLNFAPPAGYSAWAGSAVTGDGALVDSAATVAAAGTDSSTGAGTLVDSTSTTVGATPLVGPAGEAEWAACGTPRPTPPPYFNPCYPV